MKIPLLESLFKKVASLQASGLQMYQKKTPKQVFSCEYCKFLRTFFFYRTSPVAASGENIAETNVLVLINF